MWINNWCLENLNITAYHAKYFAYALTRKISSDNVQKFASTLLDAQVDLNPHQIEASLFAFRSPLSNGAILADEVGLSVCTEARNLNQKEMKPGGNMTELQKKLNN